MEEQEAERPVEQKEEQKEEIEEAKKEERRKRTRSRENGVRFNKERVAAFNDAVIAIAMTLLVLNIHPNVEALSTNADVWKELRRLLPDILAFALSFWVISRFWITNQLFFQALSILDMRTLLYNTIFLFIIVLLPFPTELLAAAHLTQATVIIYAVTLALASGVQAIMWQRLLAPERRVSEVTKFAVDYRILQYILSALIFLISIGLSYINNYLAIAFWLLFGFTRLFSEMSAETLLEFEDQFTHRRTRMDARRGAKERKPRS